MIDLHVHTTASDGQYSPTEIIQKAVDKNLKAIAITDHDTVSGLEEAKLEAEKHNIEFIPGTELNINFPTGEFHLLGLGLTHISDSLQTILNNLVDNRIIRNEQIVQKCRDLGFDITMEELITDFPNTNIGRPHIAAELVKHKIVKDRQMAFNQYLAKGRSCYVNRIGANLDEAIIAIKESGGAPVLAHPMSLYISWGKLPDVIKDFYDRGIVGLEAYHPGARPSECSRLEELGRKLGMFITASSDFHGEKVRSDRRLGHTTSGKKIEDRFWTEELKPYLESIHSN